MVKNRKPLPWKQESNPHAKGREKSRHFPWFQGTYMYVENECIDIIELSQSLMRMLCIWLVVVHAGFLPRYYHKKSQRRTFV